MDEHGWVTCGVLAIVAIIAFIFGPSIWTSNTDNVKMYEDEMIVSIDDYQALQEAVVTLQEGMKLLLAGEPQTPATPPSLTTYSPIS